MVFFCFVILLMFVLSMGEERYHDMTLIELPLDNDVEIDGTFLRYRRHPTNSPKSTAAPPDDVVAVPLRPGLAALPPHMNIKPSDKHDFSVYTCEAIQPSSWIQLPTKPHKVNTKTPPKNEILPATSPVHSTPSPIEKPTPLQPIQPKYRPQNEDSLTLKVSAFDIEGKNKTNTEETTTSDSSQQEDGNKTKINNDVRKDKDKYDKNQENSTADYENQNVNKEDKDNDKEKTNFTTTKSPKQDGNNKQETSAHSPKHDNNKINNVGKDANKGNGNKNTTSSSPSKIYQSQNETKNTGRCQNAETSHAISMSSTITPLQKYNESENNQSLEEKGKDALGTLVDTNKNGAKSALVAGGTVLIVGGVAIETAGKAVGLAGAGGGPTVGGGSGGSPQNPPGKAPSNPDDQLYQNKPTRNNDNTRDKSLKQRQINPKKEDDFENDFDFDLDDLFNEDDFKNYDKYKIELHSIDNVTAIFADKFKRLEHVCEWFANNFTNELNNLTKFRYKYFDMARKVQKIREKLGDKIERAADDIYNQMVEGYNAGTLIEKELQNFDKEIDHIHTMISQFSDAASIVENESFRMKTYLVKLMLGAKDFIHPLYRVVGAVRVLTSVAQLRTMDCLSPYISVYQTWRGILKKFYLEGIQLERNTYRSLSRESYSNMDEWYSVKGKFSEFIKRAKNELQDARQNVESLREPIYSCVIDVAGYMFHKFTKILPEIQNNIKT